MKKRHLNDQFLVYYEQFADPLFRFCYYKVSDRELAKDIVQDAFVKTIDYIRKGGDVKNPKAFLYRAANNMIIDHYRKHSSSSLNDMMEQGFDPVFEDSQSLTDRIDGAIAMELLRELEPAQREVIMLRYVEELSIKEIAEVQDEKENTISVRLHRGIQRLKEVYQEKQQIKKYESKD